MKPWITTVRLSSLVEKATESPLENGLIDDRDAGAMVGSRMPATPAEELLFQTTHADTDETLRPMDGSPYTFLDPPVPFPEMEETKPGAQFPIPQPAPTDNKLLIFLSSKGGAGVTTLACNFAVSLAQDSGKRVLLIDLNLPLGDAALNLGIKAKYTIMDAFQNPNRLDSTYLSTLLEQHSSGLFVLSAPSELARGEASRKDIYSLLAVAHNAVRFCRGRCGNDARHHAYLFL